ncbi:LLM class flavin-dependent oxidoreductase [Tepidiforma sp.]|jgi:probable F420-dependent oxidoreductase|uniref:LLM class flavin-dependent oxidoreductase n=1 Tax=Tepidiforma sp. TaxID=2682230 RepID=UPI0021DB97B4|nr:LLM class flavin-dependent oxidoreductase [Tepidiforma sp.]MCX7617508.1 LLM class flavin-dependent oxidoreductase [Tepidiforma sp.]GIW17682.1 MAG: LLM class F420-dependent oxidoreductase [Tepidiforma sp.]
MGIGIGFGVAGFPFSSADAFGRWIDLLEERGADSVWFSERLVSSAPTLEPMAAIGMALGRTRRLKAGMNAVVVPFRDPLVLAKECATLDYLSGGRLLPVFGVGDERAPEWRATGRDPRGRGAAADEALEIMARLWAGERLTFAGQHYRYTEAVISPLPVQQPLPLWIGGSSEAAVRRTARLGTGWLAGLQTPAQVAPIVAAIKRAAAEAGRTIDEDHYGAGFSYRFGSADEPVVQRQLAGLARLPGVGDPLGLAAVGGAAEIAQRIREFIAAGVSKFVVRPIAENDDDLMAQTARLLDEVVPLFAPPKVSGRAARA